jgi:soluble lytic murein transglycosylase-like protein
VFTYGAKEGHMDILIISATIAINLATLAQIESSNDPSAYNEATKARGLYQITPICLLDYHIQTGKEIKPSELFYEDINRRVCIWYLAVRIPQLLKNYGEIPLTVDNVLAAYHAGIGNLMRGTIGKQTHGYIKKYHKIEEEKLCLSL